MLTYPMHLQNGPGPLLALLPDTDPDALAEAAVALANTDGGTVVIGLDQRGAYTGAPADATVERLLRAANERCTPPVRFGDCTPIDTPDGPVIAVPVLRGAQVHALHDGRVLARTATGSRLLNGDEIRALISTRTTGDFEAERIPGARPSHLDPALVAEFMGRYQQHTGQRASDDLLVDCGAATSDGGITVAGMLLFGAEPQRWLPHSGAQFVRIIGTQIAGDGRAQKAVDRRLTGPAPRLIDTVWDLLQQQITPNTYPDAAVREALVNAICHRDYRLRGNAVTVTQFNDRLEITSPGGLPGFLTLDHLTGGRFSRNPRVAWGLYHWGYTSGGGMLQIMMSMDRRSHRPPEIEAGPYSFTVRLYTARAPEQPAPPDESDLNERQRQVLAYVRARGSITLRELRLLCAGARSDVLQGDLADLVAGDWLRKMGSRSNPYYIITH